MDAVTKLVAVVRALDLYDGSSGSVDLKDELDELCDAAEPIAKLQSEAIELLRKLTIAKDGTLSPTIAIARTRRLTGEAIDLLHRYEELTK